MTIRGYGLKVVTVETTKVVCPFPSCGREFKNRRGLHVHVADHLSRKVGSHAESNEIGNRREPYPDEGKQTESDGLAVQTESHGIARETAPTGRNIFESKDKELAIERQARQAAETTLSGLQAKVAELSVPKETPPPELPGVRDFLAHCESGNCGHAREWQAVKSEIIQFTLDNLPPDVVKSKAEALGLIPHTLTIRDVERLLEAVIRCS